jgi:acyl carrier protein
MLASEELIKIIKQIVEEDIDISPQSPLVGSSSLIDSMGLVQICLALEEKSQSDGFSFDWTSEKAMSSLNSIFKTPETLAEEYNRQLAECSQ